MCACTCICGQMTIFYIPIIQQLYEFLMKLSGFSFKVTFTSFDVYSQSCDKSIRSLWKHCIFGISNFWTQSVFEFQSKRSFGFIYLFHSSCVRSYKQTRLDIAWLSPVSHKTYLLRNLVS